MKKIILFIVFLVFSIGCWSAYQYSYGGSPYYTQIVTEGEHSEEADTSGSKINLYVYTQKAYDENGQGKEITLHEYRDKPLRLEAYLKLKVNPRKGVISWEEVKQDEVPKKALAKLK